MSTGEPHPLAADRWIKYDLWPAHLDLAFPELVISVSDRVLSTLIQGRLVSWNWRTGAKIVVSFVHPNTPID